MKDEISEKLSKQLSFNHTDSEDNIKRNYEFVGTWISENIQAERFEFLKYINKFFHNSIELK